MSCNIGSVDGDTIIVPVQSPTSTEIRSSYKTFILAQRTQHVLSILELLPREIRNDIYSHVGLGTALGHMSHGVPVACRHIFEIRNSKIMVFRSAVEGEEWKGGFDTLVDAKTLVKLMATKSMFKEEIAELLFTHAVLVIAFDEQS